MQFVGIFFADDIKGTLANTDNKGGLHVTLSYRPSEDIWAELKPYIGKEVEVKVVGYGNDGQNEGLLVEFDGIPYYGAEKKHITLSIAEGAKAVNTGFLDFSVEGLREFKKTHRVPSKLVGVISTY